MTCRAPTLSGHGAAIHGALFAFCFAKLGLADEGDVEVLVRGSNADRRASSDVSAASTVLRRADLDSPGATAATALARVPGVQVQQTGSSSDLATASIRGTTSAQTPVYLAGIRLNDDLSGTADLSTVPLWMLDRVEVYRGNAPTNAEMLGMGGAVLFEPRYPRGYEARTGVGMGSWGQKAGHLAIGAGSSKAQSLFAIRRESARNDYGYLDNAGTAFDTTDDRWLTRTNADQVTTDWWNVSRVNLGGAQLLLLSNAFARDQGVPGLLAIPATHSRARVRRELVGVSARSEVACGAHRPCELLSATSFQSGSSALSDPLLELGLGAPSVVSEARRVSQLDQLSWPIAANWSLTPHATFSAETLAVTRPGAITLEARRLQSSVGASTQWNALSHLSLVGVARLDVEATRAASEDTVNRLPIGRLSAAYGATEGLSLLANAGYYSRVPTLGELYGTSALVVGNPNLRPEHGLNKDIGARYLVRSRSVGLAAETFVFQQDLANLVGWQRSSFGQIRPYNVGHARLRGIETYLGLDLFAMFHAELATTLLDPRDTTPLYKNDILPFRARLVTDARVEVHTPAPSSALRLRSASVSLRCSHRSSRYQDAAGLIIIPHSTTFDLQSGVEFRDLPVTLRAAVYNLFDQPRFDLVGYPLPPRTFAIEAALEWERTP